MIHLYACAIAATRHGAFVYAPLSLEAESDSAAAAGAQRQARSRWPASQGWQVQPPIVAEIAADSVRRAAADLGQAGRASPAAP